VAFFHKNYSVYEESVIGKNNKERKMKIHFSMQLFVEYVGLGIHFVQEEF
jgi:hypothetical protein